MKTLTNPATAPNIPNAIKELSSSLNALAPVQNETTQIINYALIATAVVGLFIYHYIKQQEKC